MAGYFLFRNQELVGTGLGAGHLHDVGQEGDVLVYDGHAWLTAYKWYHQKGDLRAWIPINLTDKQKQRWKALILLVI